MDAIIFTSNTGYTAQYAHLLAHATGLPVYPLSDAHANVDQGAEIIYLGWLMAGSVKGYKKAAQRYHIRAVCPVGMGQGTSQEAEIRKRYTISETPVFVLQGGFDIKKLHGIYKFMMNTMIAVMGKTLAKKPDKTQEEADMLDMLHHGGNRVSTEKLAPVLQWWEENKQ